MPGGFQLASVELREVATLEEFSRRIGQFAQNLSAGRWILGGDWDHERWPDAPLPRRERVDSLITDVRVELTVVEGAVVYERR